MFWNDGSTDPTAAPNSDTMVVLCQSFHFRVFYMFFYGFVFYMFVPAIYIHNMEQDLDFGMEALLEVFPQYRGEAPSCAEGSVNALHIVLLSNPLAEEEVRRTVHALCDFTFHCNRWSTLAPP